ncbi:MAG: hypothetical protein SFU27_00360 [Thermonemataceae bacterium]|nr:hypothetical protein [Thermonemataceae bacterium]
MKKLIIISFILRFSTLSAQTTQQLKSNIIWLGIKTGYSQSKMSGLDEWLVSEGLSQARQNNTAHRLLGFDLMYELGRIPIGFSPTFHISGRDKQLSFLLDITLQSGYTIIKKDKLNLKALGGIGFGYARLDLNGVPSSFQSIAVNYSSPYPRLSFLNLRPSLMFSYTPFYKPKPDKKGNIHYQAIFYSQAGFNYFFNHRWKYGEVTYNDDINEDNSFSGVAVSMPDLLKSNLFVTFGVAFAMQSK